LIAHRTGVLVRSFSNIGYLIAMDVTPEYLPRLETLLPILTIDSIVWRSDRLFSRQSWQNRTRLRNADGWQWITVPVERGQTGEAIRNTRIAYHDGWRKRHVKALQYNYSTTPFYEHYAPDLTDLLSTRYETVGALNHAALKLILAWLKHPVRWLEPDDLLAEPDRDPSSIAPLVTDPFEHPVYQQNYNGFHPDMSCLDILFNHGPAAVHKLARSS